MAPLIHEADEIRLAEIFKGFVPRVSLEAALVDGAQAIEGVDADFIGRETDYGAKALMCGEYTAGFGAATALVTDPECGD